MIHKSLGKQQIYSKDQNTQNMGMEVENMTLSPLPISDETHDQMQIEQSKSKN